MSDNREMLASMSPDELRSAMRSLGYRTQNDLAQAIGVSRSAVSLWLEGKVGCPALSPCCSGCSSRPSAGLIDLAAAEAPTAAPLIVELAVP